MHDCTYNIGGESSDGLTPVHSGRFQVLDVDERQDIKSFVQKNSLVFKTGRGFYEFTKAEKISDKKEVVLIDKVKIESVHEQKLMCFFSGDGRHLYRP